MFRITLLNKPIRLTAPRRSVSRNAAPKVPVTVNEPTLEYRKGSTERINLEAKIKQMKSQKPIEVPLIIGGKEVKTGVTSEIRIPHNHQHVLGVYHRAGPKETRMAIEAALAAREKWAKLDFEYRASIMLRFAELLSTTHRPTINAATVLGQSKNFFQAEIDAACETIDFTRFNVKFAESIYTHEQPTSTKGVWNRSIYRPLEGFVYAVTPFNFTAIAANLCLAPVMMGNVVVWKPSDHAIYSNYHIMKILQEAGMPEGVINFIPGDPEPITNEILGHPQFAGIHYTGSTKIFQDIWRKIGDNLPKYKSYPKLVGETGGKDFVVAHSSANVEALVTALLRGAFEFAGQKCSAASRAFIPSSIWPKVKQLLLEQAPLLKVGNPEEISTFVNAVIHKQSFEKNKYYIEYARNSKDAEIIFGGKCDDSVGYFVEPTIVVTSNPMHKLMVEEIFGPVLTIHVYPDAEFSKTLKIVDSSTQYALTGSIFAQDTYALREAFETLEDAAGNFYINDKPTGAVVGQQPFGGARLSGTNDKAGSYLNLLRWVSPRTVKETLVPPTHFSYPYMKE